MSTFFSNAKKALDKFNSILTSAGYKVETDKAKFIRTERTGNVFTVSFETINAIDVREQERAELKISVLVKHSYNKDTDLMNFIDDVLELFEDYTLDGEVIGCKFSGMMNGWETEERKRSVCILDFIVMV